MIDFPEKTLFFGCGNMGGAILKGWLNAGVRAQNFHVISPSKRPMPKGVSTYFSASEFDDSADMLIVGIKPQMLDDLLDDIRSLINENTIIISILAGIKLEYLQAIFLGNSVIRMMPNLAVSLGKSPIGLIGNIPYEERQYYYNLFAPLGTVEWGEDDEFINIVTAMAGSGPAYVYRFIDALSQAAASLGMEKEQAMRLAKTMVDGASELALMADDTPRELAKKVTSKGGTTAAGLEKLDKEHALEHLVEECVRAARDRGEELARLSTKKIN